MPRELLIAAGPGEWRAALLEDGAPLELFVERGGRSEAGSIYLGRVRRLVPGLSAVLVDIGSERLAFLPQGEVVPRGKRLDEGARVLVQIRREAQGGKAARVTMVAALRGRLVELIAGRPGLRDSNALTPEERNQLLASIEPLAYAAPSVGSPIPPGQGAGRLQAGEGAAGLRVFESAPADALAAEAASLAHRWRDILDRASRLDPPARIDPVQSFAAALAGVLPETSSRIIVDDPAIIPETRAAFPEAPVEHLPETEWDIDLDEVFTEALSETIAMPGAGSVHFEATRAGLLIDVDSGSPATGSPERTALATNLAAAAVIARQLRLRNVGGGIVVDFVGLDSRALRDRVRTALTEAMGPDPRRPQILGWTRLGYLELVRPRRGRPLGETLLEPRSDGVLVKTAVTVAHEALRALRREARAQPGQNWRLIVAPEVAQVLARRSAYAVKIARHRFAGNLAIETAAGYNREQFDISMM